MSQLRSLRQKEVRALFSEVKARLQVDEESLDAKSRIDVLPVDGDELILIDRIPSLIRKQAELVPSLMGTSLIAKLPRIVVDMGAVPHICNGADVMARGVVGIEGSFEKDAFAVVVDERHRKPLAIGVALLASTEMKVTKSGKVVKNEHYVGDKFWEVMKNIE